MKTVHDMLKTTRTIALPHSKVHQLQQRPLVFLEGLDGTGKSTLAKHLLEKLGDSASLLRSPPEELLHLRPHFDKQADKEARRAFYLLSNYACAVRIGELAAKGPVVVDRFWPSTVAYAMALDKKIEPGRAPEDMLEMPKDLLELLPAGHPMVFLLLDLSEAERAARVRARALPSASAGPALAVTEEEEELERSRADRERLRAAYLALSVAGDALIPCDGAGSEPEVLERALQLIGETAGLVPESVNWHLTRLCNYSCKFCFHTAKSDKFLPGTREGMEESKRCLRKLRDAGMKKINFSGGEPFLYPKALGELCQFCKQELCVESVSIISNGSKIREGWLDKYGEFVDILAVSCDSFVEERNAAIGRGKGMHVRDLKRVRTWCENRRIPFKLNSVITTCNVDEDMHEAIRELKPVRWKVFQCLLLSGENEGEDALRDARDMVITREQFEAFVERHRDLECLVREDNRQMKDSYLILDEELRFLDCTGGAKRPSRSLQHVSVTAAMREAGFDSQMFRARGGVYAWSRSGIKDIEDAAGACGVSADAKESPETARTRSGSCVSGEAAAPRMLPDADLASGFAKQPSGTDAAWQKLAVIAGVTLAGVGLAAATYARRARAPHVP